MCPPSALPHVNPLLHTRQKCLNSGGCPGGRGGDGDGGIWSWQLCGEGGDQIDNVLCRATHACAYQGGGFTHGRATRQIRWPRAVTGKRFSWSQLQQAFSTA